MKTHRIPLTIGCLMIIAAGCAMQMNQATTDPAAKYVVIFGSPGAPIDLKQRDVFIAKLMNASWRREITFKPHKNNDPDPNSTPTNATVAHTVHMRSISQDATSNPNSQQVTQRVGFRSDQKPLLQEVLDQIKE